MNLLNKLDRMIPVWKNPYTHKSGDDDDDDDDDDNECYVLYIFICNWYKIIHYTYIYIYIYHQHILLSQIQPKLKQVKHHSRYQ